MCAISAERRATRCAVGWGVVTIRSAPAAAAGQGSSRRRLCPAAGRQQVVELPPFHVLQELDSALCSIGPRHTTAASSSTKKPIDMTFTPCASSGMILRWPTPAAEWRPGRTCAGSSTPTRRRPASPRACLRAQCGGEIGGERRLADAALAGADAQNVATCASAPSGRLAAPQRSRSAAFSVSESTSKKTFTCATPSSVPTACATESGSGRGSDSPRWLATRSRRPPRWRRSPPSDHLELDDRAA